MTIILGLNAYHGDAAACLLRDGVLVAAAEVRGGIALPHLDSYGYINQINFYHRCVRYLDDGCMTATQVLLLAITRPCEPQKEYCSYE